MFKVETVINGHPLVKLLLEYLGYVIYGAIFYLVLKKNKIFRKDVPAERNSLIYQKKKVKYKNFKTFINYL
jgi:hypothetical protein